MVGSSQTDSTSASSLASANLKEEFSARIEIRSFAKVFEDGKMHLPLLLVNRAVFRVSLHKKTSQLDLLLCRVDEGTDVTPVFAKIELQLGGRTKVCRDTTKPIWMVRPGLVQSPDMACDVFTFGDLLCGEEFRSTMEEGSEKADLLVTMTRTFPAGELPPDHRRCLGPQSESLILVSDPVELVTITSSDGFNLCVAKAVLSTHSKVLKAMLESVMIEGKSGHLQLTDVPQDVLKDFILCLCTGGLADSVCSSIDRIVHVLALADRYEVSPLADACVWVLSTAISANTVVKIIALAERNRLGKLMRALMNFVKHDAKLADVVMNADEYSNLQADTVRDIMAHLRFEGGTAGSFKDVVETPPYLQWSDVNNEFKDNTDWQNLHANSLRRACFERGLATVGPTAELVTLLASVCPYLGDLEPESKRCKTATPSSSAFSLRAPASFASNRYLGTI